MLSKIANTEQFIQWCAELLSLVGIGSLDANSIL